MNLKNNSKINCCQLQIRKKMKVKNFKHNQINNKNNMKMK